MALSNLTVQQTYVGTGSLKDFPIPFAVIEKDSDEVKVYTRDDSVTPPLAALMVAGSDYDLTGRPTINDPNTTVSFRTAPLANVKVIVERELLLTQTYDVDVASALNLTLMERAYDRVTALAQQNAFRLSRIPQYKRTSAITPQILPDPVATTIIGYDATGNLVNYKPADLLSIANPVNGKLRQPTDLVYGGPAGNPAKIAVDDLYEDAFDKVATLFSKITPTPPDNLAGKALTIPGSYQAREAGTGVLHPVAIDSGAPTITPGLASTLANSFSDAESGILTGEIDAVLSGSVTLTAASEAGATNMALTVVDDFDPYLGQGFGKEGIFKAITAKLVATALAVGLHTSQLKHSKTGNSLLLNFYVDDPAAPVLSAPSAATSGGVTYKSGVPGLAAGSLITVGWTIANAVKTHYNATRIGRATSGQTTAVDYQPGTPPAANASVTASAALAVLTNTYSENVQATLLGYNSKGGQASQTYNTGARVDTVGAETRVTSSTGQYPSSGYGQAYDSTLSLANNKALQYLNGVYRYPPLVSYTGAAPAGPDYTGLTPDTYNNNRWTTFQLGSISAATSIAFAFSAATGMGSSALVSGMDIQVRVDGASGTAGWINANAAYPGVGNPTNNGDGALDVSNSTATSKRVTFGSAPKTGTVFVRVGIPSGSSITFGGVA